MGGRDKSGYRWVAGFDEGNPLRSEKQYTHTHSATKEIAEKGWPLLESAWDFSGLILFRWH